MNKTRMIEVPSRDADNYSRILTLLGMEEEGDPLEEVERMMNRMIVLEAALNNYQEIVSMLPTGASPVDQIRGLIALARAGG